MGLVSGSKRGVKSKPVGRVAGLVDDSAIGVARELVDEALGCAAVADEDVVGRELRVLGFLQLFEMVGFGEVLPEAALIKST